MREHHVVELHQMNFMEGEEVKYKMGKDGEYLCTKDFEEGIQIQAHQTLMSL